MSPCPAKQRRERGEVLEHERDPNRPSDERLAEILTTATTIAVVGMSDTEGKAARSIPRILVERGWNVVPVNPHRDTIAGARSFPTLADVPDEWLEPVPGYDTPESLRERYVEFLRARLDGGRPWLPVAEPAQEA